MAREKMYNKTAIKYKDMLEKHGYTVTFNWTDPYGGSYEDITIRGAIWRGYGTEFSTPKAAWEYVRRHL